MLLQRLVRWLPQLHKSQPCSPISPCPKCTHTSYCRTVHVRRSNSQSWRSGACASELSFQWCFHNVSIFFQPEHPWVVNHIPVWDPVQSFESTVMSLVVTKFLDPRRLAIEEPDVDEKVVEKMSMGDLQDGTMNNHYTFIIYVYIFFFIVVGLAAIPNLQHGWLHNTLYIMKCVDVYIISLIHLFDRSCLEWHGLEVR